MVRFQVGKPVVVFGGIKRKPESKPPSRGWQGVSADDWVTVWLPGLPAQVNWTMVPLAAVMLAGMNWKIPPGVAASAPT